MNNSNNSNYNSNISNTSNNGRKMYGINKYGVMVALGDKSISKLKKVLEQGADPSYILIELMYHYYNERYDNHTFGGIHNRKPPSVKYPIIVPMINLLLDAGGTFKTKSLEFSLKQLLLWGDIAVTDLIYKKNPSFFNNKNLDYIFNNMKNDYINSDSGSVLLYLWGIAHGLIPMYNESEFHKTSKYKDWNSNYFANHIFGPLIELTKYVDLLSNKNIKRCLTLMFGAEKASEMISRAVNKRIFNRRAPLLAHRENYIESVNKTRAQAKRENNKEQLVESDSTAHKNTFKESGNNKNNTKKGGRRPRHSAKTRKRHI